MTDSVNAVRQSTAGPADPSDWDLAEEIRRMDAGLLDAQNRFERQIQAAGSAETDTAPGADKKLRVVPARITDTRPIVCTTDRNLDELTLEVWRNLVRATESAPTLFRRGGELVRVARDPVRVEPLNEHRLRHEIAQRMSFSQRTREGLTHVSPPKDLVQNLLADPEPPLPRLAGLRDGFAFAPDGRLVGGAGFDRESGFYIVNALEIPEFSGSAAEALSFLTLELLSDFPFASAADLSNAQGFLLSAHLRPTTGRAPLFGAEAPTPGTGKGLLAEVGMLSAYGPDGYLLKPLGGDDEEVRKGLTSALREARPGLLIDNPNRSLTSESLAAFLTANVWSDRVLGGNSIFTAPNDLLLAVALNNPNMSHEIARRYCRIRLESKDAHPEERTGFRHPDLKVWTLDHRGEIAAAVARIVEEWKAAGSPLWSGRPLGSFDRWSSIIGGILEFCGERNFLGNRREVFELSDSQGAAWSTFIRLWWGRFRSQEVGARDLFDLTAEVEGLIFRGNTDRAQRTAFGSALKKLRGRIFDALEVVFVPSGRNGATYRLEPLGNPGEPWEPGEHRSSIPCARARGGDEPGSEVPEVPEVPDLPFEEAE